MACGRGVLVGAIAGVVVGVLGAFVLPLFGLPKAAHPIAVGAITGIVAPWIGKFS